MQRIASLSSATRARLALCVLAALLAALLAAFPADAQRVDSRLFQSRLERLERDISLMQRQLARGGAVIPEGISENGMDAASLDVKLSQMEEQLRRLQGSIEETQFGNKQTREQLEKLSKNLELRLTRLEHGAPVAGGAAEAPAPAPQAEAPKEESPPPAKEEPPLPVDTSGELSEPAPEAPPAPKPAEPQTLSLKRGANARDDYNAAFKLLRQSKPKESSAAFEKFLKDYPGDPLAGNAYYWMGEGYYTQRNYMKAADAFRKGFEAFPNGPKAPDNLYKLALALNALKEDDKACVVLGQLVSKYGTMSETVKSKAEKERTRIGCE